MNWDNNVKPMHISHLLQNHIRVTSHTIIMKADKQNETNKMLGKSFTSSTQNNAHN